MVIRSISRRLTTTFKPHFNRTTPPPSPAFVNNNRFLFLSLTTTPDVVEGVFRFIGTVATLTFAFSLGIRMKKVCEDILYVKRSEKETKLTYDITSLKGAYEKSITAEIWNGSLLVVGGRLYRPNGTLKVLRRDVKLPNRYYDRAKKIAKFYPDLGLLVVEISGFERHKDINIEVEEKS
ncbi:hypothetical protein CTI12_AA443830 [Artemisia annua]|uniref:Uncharacterized protein n=1 Tax=Artemisia annua TaxID=35608 RepID=A0A2U1LXD6_ARTAN|nr:hypothetical protein CTI12_AA443830 [Artemisia annua]